MQPPLPHSRVNLVELRAQMFKKLGPERSKQYFYYLSRLLSLKISKVQFDQLCLRVLGRENVPLHNQFIQSILKNACHAKTPPTSSSGSYLLSNGNALPLSPQKVQLGTSTITSGTVNFGSGDLYSFGVQKPMQHHQVVPEKTGYDGRVFHHHPDKLPLTKGSSDGVVPVNSRYHNIEFLDRNGNGVSSRSVPEAPLGIPFCSVSVGGTRRALPSVRNDRFAKFIGSGGLLDTGTLREHMQQIAIAHDLEGVSMDCANLLNNGLDSYLKRLIRSCIDLAGARSSLDLMSSTYRHPSHGRLVNGVLPGHLFQVHGSSRPSLEAQRPSCPLSLLDFKVATELNPHRLGENWPLLLERICNHAYED